MALFKIYIDREGLYRFLLKLNTRDIIFISLGFKTHQLCLKSLEVFKLNATKDTSYQYKKTKFGRPYYNFKLVNTSHIIGVSELFLNTSFMHKQIALIKKNVKNAAIDACIYST